MTTIYSRTAVKFAALVVCAAGIVPAAAQTIPTKTNNKVYEVTGTKQWVETNIDLRGGAKLRFTAAGKITYLPDQSSGGKLRKSGTLGPAGLARGWADLVHQYAVNDDGHGALIGRLGSNTYAQAFLVWRGISPLTSPGRSTSPRQIMGKCILPWGSVRRAI